MLRLQQPPELLFEKCDKICVFLFHNAIHKLFRNVVSNFVTNPPLYHLYYWSVNFIWINTV